MNGIPTKLSEKNVFNTRPKVEEHVLIVMNKSTHEEHLSQPLQTKNKQFKLAVTFLTGYKGIFNVKNSNNMFYFKKTITDLLTVMILHKLLYHQVPLKLKV